MCMQGLLARLRRSDTLDLVYNSFGVKSRPQITHSSVRLCKMGSLIQMGILRTRLASRMQLTPEAIIHKVKCVQPSLVIGGTLWYY